MGGKESLVKPLQIQLAQGVTVEQNPWRFPIWESHHTGLHKGLSGLTVVQRVRQLQ